MNDVTGREINIGDKVVTTIGGYTDSLVIRYVLGFTPKKVVLRTKDTFYNSCKYNDILKFPNQIAVVSPQVKVVECSLSKAG